MMETIATHASYQLHLPTPLDLLDSAAREAQLMMIAEALAETGALVLDDFFSQAFIRALVDEFDSDWSARMAPAGVGRRGDAQHNTDIRRDKIIWLEPETPAVGQFLAQMDALKTQCNRALYLGLFEYEAHFSLYQPGDFYLTHRDAFRGQAGRKLSTVLYLNEDWPQDAGGALGVYDNEGAPLFDVLPEAGRLVLFLSEEFPHEVKPARLPRKSIAGWFRVNQGIL